MFAHNERISTRQFKRLLTLELFGVTTVVLPGLLCETVKRDGMTALLGGMVGVLLFGLVLRSIAKCSGRSLQLTLKKKSYLIYEIFIFVMLVQMILMGIWILTLAAEMSRDILLQGMDLRLVIVTFAIVSILGAIKGMECRGRMAEVLYLFLLVPFILLLILAARKVNMDFMPPIMSEPPKVILNGSYEVFIVFQGVMLGFFALPYLKHQKYFWKGVRKSILLNSLFCFLLMGISIGIFGINGAASQKWLAVNLMTTPDFPGGLVERLDVLMVTIWIVSLFFFVSGSIFYGGKMAGRLFRVKHEKTGILVVAALIVAGSLFMGNLDYSYYVYLNYMKYIGVPLMAIVLLLVLWRLRPRKALAVTACMVMVLCLSGCAKGVELEDREFVIALGVDWDGEKVQFYYDTANTSKDSQGGNGGQSTTKIAANGFYEVQSVYGEQSDKYLDYNHLKTIIIGKNLASNQSKLIELLKYIEKNELFARNTKLFFVEDSLDSIFEMSSQMDTELGEYLENMYVDSNYYVEGQSASLGDLLNHWHDWEEMLLVPVLVAKDSKPLVDSYAVVRKAQWIDQMQTWEANLVFLANGVNVQTDVTVDKRYVVDVESARREIAFLKEEFPVANVTIKLRGKIVNEDIEEEKTKRNIEDALEQQLEQLYKQTMTDWRELDVFHLYRALGNHDRQLWEEYENRRLEFNQNVVTNVFVKVIIE